MTETVTSKNGILIRPADERWAHITEEHTELAGGAGEMLALRPQPDGKTLVVVYRDDANDGFIITAFLTRRETSLRRRQQLWP